MENKKLKNTKISSQKDACSSKWSKFNVYSKFHEPIQIVSVIRTSLTWLNFVIAWFGFRLEPIFAIAPDASKNTTYFKSGHKWHENDHLASLV